MKNIFILCLICATSYAQLSPNHGSKDLDKNYVRAKILTDNDKCWNMYGNNFAAYEVPKGKSTHAMFANSMWIGGLDNGGQLHVAANTYKQKGLDFWPGPLDTTNIAAFTATNSMPYNKLWKVDCNDIYNFVNALNTGSISANTYTIPEGILTYPAKGTANFQKNMLPFVDANYDGLYKPQTDGDYPLIKGHQQVLSIYNDKNGVHGETQGLAMGIEIYERSYAYFDPSVHDSMNAINYSTFFHYTIFNRSNTSYNNVYISDWAEIDLGNFNDDFIGTDIANNFAYGYNGNATDPTGNGSFGYLNKPPVLSVGIIKTDCGNDGVDNNNNLQIDEPGEQFFMSKTTYYNNNVAPFPLATRNPNTALDYYNYMKGIWKDGSSFTYSGTAFGGIIPANFIYSGDPSTNTGWTEASVGNVPGDRKMLISSGPFNFPANSRIEWGYTLVFSQDTTQVVNTISQLNTRVKRDVKNVRYYDETHQLPDCRPAVNVGIKTEAAKKLSVMVYPNPGDGKITVDLNENLEFAQINVRDVFGQILLQSQTSGNYRSTLDLSAFKNGIYFVEILSGSQMAVEKLVKN